MAGEVRYEVRGAAAWVIIDREEQRNALSPEVVTGLQAAIDRVGGDDAARAAVVTGAGDRAFCAGGDIRALYGAFKSTGQGDRHYFDVEYALDRRIHEYPKPIAALR